MGQNILYLWRTKTPRNKEKKIINKVEKDIDEVKIHKKVYRPWGNYFSIREIGMESNNAWDKT